MRDIRLYDSVIGDFVPVCAGDAVRVEVRTSPCGVDVVSMRPFALFSFLERFLRREGFGTKFLFDSPRGDDVLYELSEGLLPLTDEHDGNEADELEGSEVSLLEVPRSDAERSVNVCFGAARDGHVWPAAPVSERVVVSDALQRFGHSAVAFYLLGTHYSHPLGDPLIGLQTAARNVQRLRETLKTLTPDQPSPADMAHYLEAFRDALANDLDTPLAFVVLFEWVLEAERRGGEIGDKDLRVMLDVLDFNDFAAPVVAP